MNSGKTIIRVVESLDVGTSVLKITSFPNSADPKVIDEVVQTHLTDVFVGSLCFFPTSPEMSHGVSLKHGGHDPHGFKVSELRRSMVENKELDQSQVGEERIHGIPASNSQSNPFLHFQFWFGVVLGRFWRLKKTLSISMYI